MGNRSKGKSRGGASGTRDTRAKVRSSGMKQRGKGSSNNYRPNSRKGYGGNSKSYNSGGSGK